MRSGVTSSTGWPSWVGRNPALWCPEREVGKAPPLAPQLNHATAPPTGSKVDKALDAVREKFGDDAIVKGRGFGIKLNRQGPSKVE